MSDYPMLISNKLHSFRNFVKPFYKEKQIIRKGILHAVSPKEETAW